MPDTLITVSYNYQNTSLDLRDRITLSDDEALRFIDAAMEPSAGIKELAVISTCNRTEIYGVLGEPGQFHEWVMQQFLELKQVDLKKESADPTIFHYNESVEHLFGVAGGLKSMMLGENQILSQIKSSYDLILSCPYSFPILYHLFQDAIRVGKSIRTNTSLCRGSVSISLAAAELSRKIYAKFSNLKVLLVGAGKTAELTLIHFKEMGVVDFIIANRGQQRRQYLANKYFAEAIPLDELGPALIRIDIVIAATKSPDYLITLDQIKQAIPSRKHRSLLMIDISSPRNIEPQIGGLPEVFLYNMDDLDKVVAENLAKRKKEIPAAELIVQEIASEFDDWFKTLEVVPTISKLTGYFEHIRRQELKKYVHKTSDEDYQLLDDLSKSIIRKLLHYPVSGLRQQNHKGNLTVSKIDTIWDLYRLHNFEANSD
ncbi:MAG: glutamyl-tRNA reductase [Candidatus Marinimicrobia bacterium]|nr:glutamyl-tRNA reductase [Candidatus Neomarinimicrobiota bacterium]